MDDLARDLSASVLKVSDLRSMGVTLHTLVRLSGLQSRVHED